MCCTDFFADRASIRSGKSCFSTRSIKAFRLTLFFWASNTMEAPTVRTSKFCIWKYGVLSTGAGWSSTFEVSAEAWLAMRFSFASTWLPSACTSSMMFIFISFRVAPYKRSKSKYEAPPHWEQLLAARSGNVKGPSKHVLILRAAASIGSNDSNKHTVPPIICVWFHWAILIWSSGPLSVADAPFFTFMWLSCRSWSSVSRMYSGFPSVTSPMNLRNSGGTAFSGTPR
mmetsp:Transcript_12639/g.37580  ORF Transcript_12639/g.37580 Transcript_12639/m.37580 type:complete len:228 (+) Transcript_12639:243-926(+)